MLNLIDIEGVKSIRLNTPKLNRPLFNCSNPSILYDNGLFYINLRATNYTLVGKPTKCVPRYTVGGSFHTQNIIGTTTDPMVSPVNWKPVVESKTHKVYSDKIGLEDCRLVKWKGQMYLSGTRRDFNDGGMGRIMLSSINEDTRDNCWYESGYNILQGTRNDNNYCEKNHQPILDKPLCYVASTTPVFVYRANLNTNRIEPIKGNTMMAGCEAVGCIRGSSQIIPYNGMYYSIVHNSKVDNTKQHHYFHYLATFDKDFKLVHISEPFKFEGEIIEFCCGMCIVPGEEEYLTNMYISYSLMDSKPSIMEIPLPMILNL